MSYDSTEDTVAHIMRVRTLLWEAEQNLKVRGAKHDASKLQEPEKPMFDRFTPELAKAPYGSDEYRASLEAMGPALQHHYAENDHHPEHHESGIFGMNLMQLIELLADWKAAGERPGGTNNLVDSIHKNAERFGYNDHALEQMLIATAEALGW